MEKKESDDSRHVFVMTPTGLKDLSTNTSTLASLLEGNQVDTKVFMEALSSAIKELEAELESTEQADTE